MTANLEKNAERSTGHLPDGEGVRRNVMDRQNIARIWHGIFFAATTFGIFVLVLLMGTILDEAFGIVATQSEVDAETLTGATQAEVDAEEGSDDRPLTEGGSDDRPLEEGSESAVDAETVTERRTLEELSQPELIGIIEAQLNDRVLRRLEREQSLSERSVAELREVIDEEILKTEVVGSWPLHQALFGRGELEQIVAERYPRAELQFRSWVSWDFITEPMSSTPAFAGVRTALFGSLWMIAITILVAFPLGVGASIYLEEYASDNWLNRIIQTNINNLAGVPSIIYGILGLAIFVRVLAPVTSGAIFTGGDTEAANGRTILSAGLTMALLILPIIIISGQEAIRSVPNSLRQASYGLGATKWQTIWNHVLPNAIAGILTGTILSVSRALGETAPLIVVGAATFLVTDPDGPFATFTALPIQIFEWTSRPQDQFRDIAAAAIIVLLIVLLSLNATAILLRNRFSRKLG